MIMIEASLNPLSGPPCEEVPLANAPLVRVLVQARFAPILSLRNEDYIAPFQEKVRNEFPNLTRNTHQFIIAGEELEPRTENAWHFSNANSKWRVVLTTDFITLETVEYTSRSDFMRRFRDVMNAFVSTVGSARLIRLGVRYVDHIKSPELESVQEIIRAELLGLGATSLRSAMQHDFGEALCTVDEGVLLARWGHLPSNGTHDPATLIPVPEPSWFLDLDVAKNYAEPFADLKADIVHEMALTLAARAYSFFRWATTDKFIETFGE